MNTLLRAGLVLVVCLTVGCSSDAQPAAHPEAEITPPEPVSVTIPKGSFAAEISGEPGFGLPKYITLTVGQVLVVKNDDTSLHYLMNKPVFPGQTIALVFDMPGEYVNTGGLSCSLTDQGPTVINVVPK